jgi:F0F1-type ATP synthase assembly protein I
MSNLKTELKALWKITKFMSSVLLGLAFGWLVIVSLFVLIGN